MFEICNTNYAFRQANRPGQVFKKGQVRLKIKPLIGKRSRLKPQFFQLGLAYLNKSRLIPIPMFDQCHGNATLPNNCISYFVRLMLKMASLFSLTNFQSISLLACLYKLISTVLVVRLAQVMNAVVATTQLTFINGRNLVDGGLWNGEENGSEIFTL